MENDSGDRAKSGELGKTSHHGCVHSGFGQNRRSGQTSDFKHRAFK
jgi:hypothetical protein